MLRALGLCVDALTNKTAILVYRTLGREMFMDYWTEVDFEASTHGFRTLTPCLQALKA